MLYNIFIQPLVIILRAIYLGINYFAGNLGISLMILSVVMSILLRPFIKWAAGVQDKERKIQNILSPQIAEIKKRFKVYIDNFNVDMEYAVSATDEIIKTLPSLMGQQNEQKKKE